MKEIFIPNKSTVVHRIKTMKIIYFDWVYLEIWLNVIQCQPLKNYLSLVLYVIFVWMNTKLTIKYGQFLVYINFIQDVSINGSRYAIFVFLHIDVLSSSSRKVPNVQCVGVIYENRNGIHHRQMNDEIGKSFNSIFSMLMLFLLLFWMVIFSFSLGYKEKSLDDFVWIVSRFLFRKKNPTQISQVKEKLVFLSFFFFFSRQWDDVIDKLLFLHNATFFSNTLLDEDFSGFSSTMTLIILLLLSILSSSFAESNLS